MLISPCDYIVSVPEVEFVSPEYTIAEDEGEVNVCLRIDRIISSPLTVRLHAVPDTATRELSIVLYYIHCALHLTPSVSCKYIFRYRKPYSSSHCNSFSDSLDHAFHCSTISWAGLCPRRC